MFESMDTTVHGNDEILTCDEDPRPPPVPVPAPDLFRQIASIVRGDEARFEMRGWHLTRDGEDIDVGNLAPKTLESVVCECGTSHCLAGWIVALTPGGLQLEHWVSQDWSFLSAQIGPSDWWATTAKVLGLSAPWLEEYRRSGSAVPTPLAALAILERGGWHRSIKGSPAFQPLFFLRGNEEARDYLESLVAEEQRRASLSHVAQP